MEQLPMSRVRYVNLEFPELEYVHYEYKGKPNYAYGRKIATHYGVRIGKKTYRIYASQIANSPMFYILVKKEMYVVPDAQLQRIKK